MYEKMSASQNIVVAVNGNTDANSG